MEYKPWCDGKTAYQNKAEALARIRHQCKNRKRRRYTGWSGDQTIHAYRCRTCGHWHVGGTSRSTKRRLREDGHV
jgi:rubrerythrin